MLESATAEGFCGKCRTGTLNWRALNQLQWNKEKVSQIASLSSRQRLLVLTQPLNDFSAVLKWLQLHFQMRALLIEFLPHRFSRALALFFCFDVVALSANKIMLLLNKYKETGF